MGTRKTMTRNNSCGVLADRTNTSRDINVKKNRNQVDLDSMRSTKLNNQTTISRTASQRDARMSEDNASDDSRGKTQAIQQRLTRLSNNDHMKDKKSRSSSFLKKYYDMRDNSLQGSSDRQQKKGCLPKPPTAIRSNSIPLQETDQSFVDDSPPQLVRRTKTVVDQGSVSTHEDEGKFVLGKTFLGHLVKREMPLWSLWYYNLDGHREVAWHMRAILMDWMIEVCAEFLLKRQTMWTAISMVDRCLQKNLFLPEKDLQLIGVSALQIAAKQEEIYAPKAVDFARTTDGGYNEWQILTMELKILQTVEFTTTVTTLLDWLHIFMQEWDRWAMANMPWLIFRDMSRASQELYRLTLQLADASILAVEVQEHSSRIAALTIMQLSLYMRGQMQISLQDYNDKFNRFLAGGIDECLAGLTFDIMMPCINLMQLFQNLPFSAEQPPLDKQKKNINDQTANSLIQEELLNFQTQQHGVLQQAIGLKRGEKIVHNANRSWMTSLSIEI